MKSLPDDLRQPENGTSPAIPFDHHRHLPVDGNGGATDNYPTKCKRSSFRQVRFRIKIGDTVLSPHGAVLDKNLQEVDTQKVKEKDACCDDGEEKLQEIPKSDAVSDKNLQEMDNLKEKEKEKDACGGDEEKSQEIPKNDAVLELAAAAAAPPPPPENRKWKKSPSLRRHEQAPNQMAGNDNNNNNKEKKEMNKLMRTEFWLALTKQEVARDMVAMKKASKSGGKRPLSLLKEVHSPAGYPASSRQR